MTAQHLLESHFHSNSLFFGRWHILNSGRSLLVAVANIDLELSILDLLLELIETALLLVALPSRAARVENVVHLLEREAARLGRQQGHVDKREAVEGGKDHVHLPIDVPQQRRDCKGKNHVPKPVGSGGK